VVPRPKRFEARAWRWPGRALAELRAEHFEDARLVGDRSRGITFSARIDVLESMGAECYAHFVVAGEQISSAELEELARDSASTDVPRSYEGSEVVARHSADSKIKRGGEAELWFDSKHLHLLDVETGRSL
jgi:multiple sugar transport system ATP-binding protein